MSDEQDKPVSTPYFSGWRPWCGWVSALGFTLQFVVFPILGAAFAICKHPITLPTIDTTAIIAMVTTTVGLGGMRTLEKFKKVNS